MSSALHEEAARELLHAHATGVPVTPISERYPAFDLDDAYQVQLAQLREWVARGRVVTGRKIGLTSPAIQRQLGIDQPDHGVLLADRGFASGAVLTTSDYISPRVEPELALTLGAELRGPGVTPAQALAAVARVSASLEIIDSRIAEWRIGIVDTIADNASSGAYVLADGGVPAQDVDLGDVRCELTRNGELAETGTSAAVLGSPVHALVWLANTLGARGVALEAGQVVLSGGITAALPVHAGDTVSATLGGVGEVAVNFR